MSLFDQKGEALFRFSQIKLSLIAATQFGYYLSFHWWIKDLKALSLQALLDCWIDCLEQAYGQMLAEKAFQQQIGECINLVIKEYRDGLRRM